MQAPYTVTVHSSQYDAILNAYNAAPTGNMTNGTATMQVTNSALGLAADSSTSANVTFTVSASSQVKAPCCAVSRRLEPVQPVAVG